MPATGHSGVQRGGRQRVSLRESVARVRSAAQRETQVPYRSEPAGGYGHLGERRSGGHARGGCRRSGSGSCGTRGHQEGQAGSRGGRRRASNRKGREAGEAREEGKEIIRAYFTTESQRTRGSLRGGKRRADIFFCDSVPLW